MTNAVVQSQSAEVDTVSGATYTSQDFKAAAQQALDKASGNLPDGEYIGSADGFNGPIVSVTMGGGAITAVEVWITMTRPSSPMVPLRP